MVDKVDDYIRSLDFERERYRKAANECLRDVSTQHDQYKAFVDHLPDRLEASEKRGSAISYRGVYDASQTYMRGQFASFDGPIWYCDRDNENEPPSYHHKGNSPWILACKKGRTMTDILDTPEMRSRSGSRPQPN